MKMLLQLYEYLFIYILPSQTKSLKSVELVLIQASGNERRISTVSLRVIIIVIIFS